MLDDPQLPTAPPADTVRATGTLLLTFGTVSLIDPVRAAQLFVEANGMQVVRARDELLIKESDGSTLKMTIRRTANQTKVTTVSMPRDRALGAAP